MSNWIDSGGHAPPRRTDENIGRNDRHGVGRNRLLGIASAVLLAVPAGASAATYEVGIGSRNISPNNADGTWDDPGTAEVEHLPVYLGGFGIGGPGVFGSGRAGRPPQTVFVPACL